MWVCRLKVAYLVHTQVESSPSQSQFPPSSYAFHVFMYAVRVFMFTCVLDICSRWGLSFPVFLVMNSSGLSKLISYFIWNFGEELHSKGIIKRFIHSLIDGRGGENVLNLIKKWPRVLSQCPRKVTRPWESFSKCWCLKLNDFQWRWKWSSPFQS